MGRTRAVKPYVNDNIDFNVKLKVLAEKYKNVVYFWYFGSDEATSIFQGLRKLQKCGGLSSSTILKNQCLKTVYI